MRTSRAIAALVLLAPLAGIMNGSLSCLDRRELDVGAANPCTSCHGSAQRSGSLENQAAPPNDLAGNIETVHPGVGAHTHHLLASATHAALACAECHQVPNATGSPGHADTALPAEVDLDGLATQGDRSPAYDPGSQSCADTYCHRDSAPIWTSPRDSAAACGSCHGLPPQLPHPQRSNCAECHGEVVDETMAFVAPELHVDGVVSPILTCHSCHGSLDSDAPPTDLAGSSEETSMGVGAHQAHLSDNILSTAVPCNSCHAVPTTVDAAGHADDELPAEIIFAGVATTAGRTPVWDRDTRRCSQSWCHGPTSAATESPEWTTTQGTLSCGSCHGFPPATPPHAQPQNCATCHPQVVNASGSIIDPALHIDGTIQVGL